MAPRGAFATRTQKKPDNKNMKMEMSESLTNLLRGMAKDGDGVAKVVLRRRMADQEKSYWSRFTYHAPVSIGFVKKFTYDVPHDTWNARLRRLSPSVEIGNYFTFREKSGMISYCPRGREQKITSDGKWAREGRQDIKPAKWARAILSPRALRLVGGDAALSAFAARFAAAEAAETYEVKPAEWEEIYSSDHMGSPVGSCMWDKPVGEFYRLTPAIPHVITKGGRPVGRFIFWPEVKNAAGVSMSLVDRIYSKPDGVEYALKWAAENGHATKAAQQGGCQYAVTPQGETVHLKGWVVNLESFIDPRDLSFVPYVDTFRWAAYDDDGEICSLSASEPRRDFYEFDCQHGGFSGGPDDHEGEVQLDDGTWVSEDEAVMVGDTWYHMDDTVYCDYGSCAGESILRGDAFAIRLGDRMGTVYVHEDDVCRA